MKQPYMKKQNFNIVKGCCLPEKLKEYGYYVAPEDINYIPFGPKGYHNKQGVLKNGKLEDVYYFDLQNTLKLMKELQEYNLPAKLKEHGYEIDRHHIMNIPYETIDDNYTYNLDRVMKYLNATTIYNLQARLKERGYDVDVAIIGKHLFGQYMDGVYCYDLEKVIAFLNATTERNLSERLKERGYDVNANDIRRIERKKYAYPNPLFLCDSEHGFFYYDLERVIEFLKKQQQTK